MHRLHSPASFLVVSLLRVAPLLLPHVVACSNTQNMLQRQKDRIIAAAILIALATTRKRFAANLEHLVVGFKVSALQQGRGQTSFLQLLNPIRKLLQDGMLIEPALHQAWLRCTFKLESAQGQPVSDDGSVQSLQVSWMPVDHCMDLGERTPQLLPIPDVDTPDIISLHPLQRFLQFLGIQNQVLISKDRLNLGPMELRRGES